MKATAGTWRRDEAPLYFVASGPSSLRPAMHVQTHMLVAANELLTRTANEYLDEIVGAGVTLLLDSGVFTLLEQCVDAGMKPEDARQLPVEDVPGFDGVFAAYRHAIGKYGARLWGYVEVDWGSTDAKRRMRAKLEDMGLAPIPVYHPLRDPPEYFDELASQYDRLCVGDMVWTDAATRLRLVATVAERRRQYPHLWVHLLGFTPSEWCHAYDFDSCDSSTWLSGVRWPSSHKARAALRAFSPLVEGMAYQLGKSDDPDAGSDVAKRAYGYDAQMNLRNWRRMREDAR